jgi:hypothetical protein
VTLDAAYLSVGVTTNKAMDGVGVDIHTEDKAGAGGGSPTVLIFNMFKKGKYVFGLLLNDSCE